MDGFTTPLLAHVNVTPGQVYHLKLAIADVSDGILNSFAILKANSLKSGNTNPSIVSENVKESGLVIFPTNVDGTLQISNPLNQSWQVEIVNLQGSHVYEGQMGAMQPAASIDLSYLPAGLYVFKMTRLCDHRVFFEKIMKR
jgi:hypothetical protein